MPLILCAGTPVFTGVQSPPSGSPVTLADAKSFPLVLIDGVEVKWSRRAETPADRLPALGDRVHVMFNNLGTGTVTGFFTEGGFLGVVVLPDAGQRPAWHQKQNPDRPHYTVFGSEVRFL